MIYLSAGHNAKGTNPDPGACANGLREADLTIIMRNLVAAELLKLHASFTVDSDSERLAEYVKRIHPGTGSVVCEFHFNAGHPSANGVEAIVKAGASSTERGLAAEICKAVNAATGIGIRGTIDESKSQHSRLAILHTGAGISVLPELCFITNVADLQRYEAGKGKLAKEIAALLVKYDAVHD